MPSFALSTSPFRKLQIAESEYGLQNFTESGYGFRIYGIEMDMYGISRGIIFCFFLEIADSTLTDSTDSRIPYGFHQKRSATPPRRSRPAPGPSPAPGAYRLAWSRTTASDRPLVIVTVDHQLAVNELKLLVVDEQSPHRAQSALRSPDYLGLAFAHIELRERYPLVLSPDSM